jgi:hypothetical protein
MTTFSQLVDDVVTELLRPDLKTAIAAYTNQTIRELHFKPGSNVPVKYDANRFEDELTITTDGSWSWAIPSATRFQDVEAIYLDYIGRYVERRNPRIALEVSYEPYADLYWYRSGPSISIAGVRDGWTGKISYFMYAQTFAYKTVSQRVVVYDADTDSYKFRDGTPGTPTEEQLDRETCWLLQRWADTVKEGVRAKAWKRLADGDRARMAYSSFESMRDAVWGTEPSS